MRYTIYLYELTDPLNRNYAYIGLSVDPKVRLNQHMTDLLVRTGRSGIRKNKWIMSLRRKNLKPILTILSKVTFKESSDAERDAIRMCKAIRGAGCLNSDILRSYPVHHVRR